MPLTVDFSSTSVWIDAMMESVQEVHLVQNGDVVVRWDVDSGLAPSAAGARVRKSISHGWPVVEESAAAYARKPDLMELAAKNRLTWIYEDAVKTWSDDRWEREMEESMAFFRAMPRKRRESLMKEYR